MTVRGSMYSRELDGKKTGHGVVDLDALPPAPRRGIFDRRLFIKYNNGVKLSREAYHREKKCACTEGH